MKTGDIILIIFLVFLFLAGIAAILIIMFRRKTPKPNPNPTPPSPTPSPLLPLNPPLIPTTPAIPLNEDIVIFPVSRTTILCDIGNKVAYPQVPNPLSSCDQFSWKYDGSRLTSGSGSTAKQLSSTVGTDDPNPVKTNITQYLELTEVGKGVELEWIFKTVQGNATWGL